MLEFLGRLHPLVLHLPIGILALAYLLEIYVSFRKVEHKEVQSLILLFAALSATISVATGLLLIRGGDYSGDLVNNHKWVAIGLGAICWTLFFLHRATMRKAYLTALASSAIMLGVTGHLGGSITHGENFLWESNDLVVRPVIEEAELYADIIHPIFQDKCVSCHNPTKLKGELDMATAEGIRKGGESGEAILTEEVTESLMWKRIHLPSDEKKHMPPDGKEQLTEDEISMLKWWINSGADFEKLAIQTDGFDEYEGTAIKFLAPPEVDLFAKIEKPDSSDLIKLKEKGIKLYPTHDGSAAVYANFSNRKDLKKSDLRPLKRISDNIAHLNLAASSFNDELISTLKPFRHLRKLELQGTNVTSKGINSLGELKFLKTLNLYNTEIDSQAIDKLLSFPQLQDLYLWKTNFSDIAIDKIKLARPRLNVVDGVEKDIFKNSALRSPLITADKDIFEDSLTVSLVLNFRDVDIRYTLNDGDTLSYKEPFKITESTTVKTLAQKEGWLPSKVNEKTFIRKGFEVDQIKLHNKPQERYAKLAEKVLANNKLGSNVFSDGEWVGYEGENSRLTMMLKNEQDISQVTIGVLEATGSYIFYPQGITISTSEGGKKFDEVASENYEMVSGPSNRGRKNLTLKFPSQKAKWVKVEVLGHLKNPEWHEAPGAKNWIFIDEIIVN